MSEPRIDGTDPERLRILLVERSRTLSSSVFLPSVLARSGRPVDAVLPRRSASACSRALANVYFTESEDDAWMAMIRDRLVTGHYALLVISNEKSLKVIYASNLLAEIEPWLPFKRDDALRDTVGHKEQFYVWCARHGLPVPDTVMLNSPQDAVTALAAMGGPCMIKGDRGAGGVAVFPVQTPADVKALEEQLHATNRWMIQRREPGRTGCCVFFAGKGRLLAWFGVRQVLAFFGGLGTMVVGAADLDPQLRELCARVAAASGITGLTAFDYVEGADGTLKLIDSHLGRTVSMNHLGLYCGVDFGAVIGRWLAGETMECVEPEIRGGGELIFVKFPECIISLRDTKLRPFNYVWRREGRLALYPAGDAGVMLRLVGRLLLSKCRKQIGSLGVCLGVLKKPQTPAILP